MLSKHVRAIERILTNVERIDLYDGQVKILYLDLMFNRDVTQEEIDALSLFYNAWVRIGGRRIILTPKGNEPKPLELNPYDMF